MKNHKSIGFTCIAVFLFSGCTHVDRDAGFSSVQKASNDRIGAVVQWRGQSADDAQVDAAVTAMLRKPLTADEAVQIALLNNRSLQATFEDLGIAQADLVQAGLLHNPVFSLNVRIPNKRPSKTYVDLSVADDFLDIFFAPARRKIAEADFETTQARVAHEVLELAARTRVAFYQYQAAEQVGKLRRSVAEAAAASLDAAKALHDAGNVTDLAYITEQSQQARAKVDVATSDGQTSDAREHLNQLMGLSGTQLNWTLDAELAQLPWADPPATGLEAVALRQRFDVAAARSQEITQGRALGLTENTSLLGGTELGAEGERETDGQWRIGPQLSVPVPIFDQGQATIARARAQLRQSRQRYEALASDVRSQVRMAAAHMRNSRLRAEYYRDHVLPLQKSLVHQTQLEYNAMLAGVFVLLQVRRDEIDAGREYIEALRDYWVARAELEQAVGGRLK
jgi:cobalt-zinc-cadmium efflux system outer membrane protein